MKDKETILTIKGILPTLPTVRFNMWSQIAPIISIQKFLKLIEIVTEKYHKTIHGKGTDHVNEATFFRDYLTDWFFCICQPNSIKLIFNEHLYSETQQINFAQFNEYLYSETNKFCTILNNIIYANLNSHLFLLLVYSKWSILIESMIRTQSLFS